MKKKQKFIFDKFTNLYSLSKTLRFELKPLPETKSLASVIKEDQEIDRLYHEEMKPMFDKLHEKFISEALRKLDLPLNRLKELKKYYFRLKLISKDKKKNNKEITELADRKSGKIVKLQDALRNVIIERFNEVGEEWKEKYSSAGIKLKKNGYKILTEKGVLGILKLLNPDKIKEIKKFDKFFTYFTGFNQNRANYYTNESKETGVANRVINENLMRFLDNRQISENLNKILPDLVMSAKDKKALSLENYKNYLTQNDINKFNQDIVGGINKKVNLLAQKNKIKVPKFKILYKQIGSEKDHSNDFEIKKGEEWQRVKELIDQQKPLLDQTRKLYNNFFVSMNDFNLNEVYFNKQAINTISSYWFAGGWQILAQKLKEVKVFKFTNDEYKIPTNVSLDEIKEGLMAIEDQNPEVIFRERYAEIYKDKDLWSSFIAIWQKEIEGIFSGKKIKQNDKEIKIKGINELLEEFDDKSSGLFDKKKHLELIKNICDSFLAIERMIKYHKVSDNNIKDNSFYFILDQYLEKTSLKKYYNAFRNFLTKKPFNNNKIKLNFENGILLDGWDIGQEEKKCGVILKNKDKYYLAVVNKKFNTVFNKEKNSVLYQKTDGDWEKMDYKLLPGPNKMLPKVCFAPKNADLFNPNENILKIKQKGSFKKANLKKADLIKWIDYLKQCIAKYHSWKIFNFKFRPSSEYDDVGQFYADVAEQGYKINFVKISETILEQMVKDEKIYLFQIYNKDLVLDESIGKLDNLDFKSKEAKDKKTINSHTQLFLELFKPENAKYLKLLGGGELFYREPSKEKNYRKDKKGKKVLVSKRYYEPKYFLHFPIEIRGKNERENFNQKVITAIHNTIDNVNIIGIDRGEKHLLYYSVINGKTGKILEQNSLNVIKCGKKEVNYNELLTKKMNEMKEARKSWEIIGKIKDLKEGYLSQAVYRIYQLIMKYNAIVVMEDLNTEFKLKRTAKVEKSVYKKFELDLAKKLNCLTLKDRDQDEIGGVLHGYQLTPGIDKVDKFEKSKQWGILFYVNPSFTSATDPLTGWRKHRCCYISSYDTNEKIKRFFETIRIEYDQRNKHFIFKYKDENKINWELRAFKGMERYKYNSRKMINELYDPYNEFSDLFTNIDKNGDINLQIKNNQKLDWKRLAFLWGLLVQIRNTDRSKEGDDNDFIQSPVFPFFDSRKVGKNMPNNGDANGAYNIARKGIIILNRIKRLKINEKKIDFFISNTEWDKFAINQK